MPIAEIRRFTWGDIELDVPAIRNDPRHGPGHPRTGRKASLTSPADRYDVQIDTELLHADPVHAVLRAREMLSTPATLSNVDCESIELTEAQLYLWGSPHGEVRVHLRLREGIPFLYTPGPARAEDALTFEKALWKAQELLAFPVYVDLIEETDAWWWFGTRQIGTLGAAVRRRDGYRECFGSGHRGAMEALLWAFDLGMTEPGASLRITRVSDPSRVASSLVQCFGFAPEIARDRLVTLPSTLELDGAHVGLLWPARDAMEFEVTGPGSVRSSSL